MDGKREYSCLLFLHCSPSSNKSLHNMSKRMHTRKCMPEKKNIRASPFSYRLVFFFLFDPGLDLHGTIPRSNFLPPPFYPVVRELDGTL